MKINWKYTFGEILIVIIGISIAFALNSWAQNSKASKVKKQYLESLISDIDFELEGLSKDTLEFDSKMRDIRIIQAALRANSSRLDTCIQRFFGLPNVVTFKPNDITYQTMINSGNISILSDFKLTKSLETHYSQHAEINLAYERQNNIVKSFFAPLMIYDMDYDAMRSGDLSILKERNTRNIVNSLYGAFMLAKYSAVQGIMRCKLMTQKLEAELIGS